MGDERTPVLTVPRLEAVPGLVHGFGGAGWSEAGLPAFAAARGLRPVVMRQVHGDGVRRLDAAPQGKVEGDALVTGVPGLLLVVRTADCLPVLLVDEARRAVGAVHCGWRGTAKRVLEKAVRAMAEAYGSRPAEMLAALGPCIGGACYEVGPEVREAFLEAGFPRSVLTESGTREPGTRAKKGRGTRAKGTCPPSEGSGEGMGTCTSGTCPPSEGRWRLDLRGANLWLLRELGFAAANVLDPGPACTHCGPGLLSYRRDPADPRRMINFIGFAA